MSVVQVLQFWVPGIPAQQGSKTVFSGRAVDANAKQLKPWRKSVSTAARTTYRGEQITDASAVSIEFRFEKPKSVTRPYPSVAPDLDKLVRAIFDGLTDSGIWRDDCLAVDLHAYKRYSDQPGALVRVGIYPTQKREKK